MCSHPQLFTKEAILATTASDEPSVSAEKVLKRQKKQARREAKLMIEIEAAKKDLNKARHANSGRDCGIVITIFYNRFLFLQQAREKRRTFSYTVVRATGWHTTNAG
jgi:hypothetical protein